MVQKEPVYRYRAIIESMIKKYLGYIVFLLLLIFALIILIGRRDSTLVKRYSDFSPGNISVIDKMIISQEGESIVLERDDQQWTLNGLMKARNDRAAFLTESLERIEIVTPVSKSLKDSIIKHLLAYGKHVRLFVRGNARKSFYVYFDTTGIAGTYMMLDKSDSPFLVRLKGYSGNNIEDIFSMDIKSWQENILFDYGPDEIREVLLEYPEAPQHSFRIYRGEDEGIMLSDLSTIIPRERISLQEIGDYLFFFTHVRFTYPEDAIPDRMVSGLPFAKLQVILNTGRIVNLNAYHFPASPDADGEYDMNRFIGLINDEHDTVILYYADMDPILRQIGDFQKK
jgi:hypothetical protein